MDIKIGKKASNLNSKSYDLSKMQEWVWRQHKSTIVSLLTPSEKFFFISQYLAYKYVNVDHNQNTNIFVNYKAHLQNILIDPKYLLQ